MHYFLRANKKIGIRTLLGATGMKTINIRLEKCVGCRSCEQACSKAHSPPKNIVDGLARSTPPRIKVQFGLPVDTGKGSRGKRSKGAPL